MTAPSDLELRRNLSAPQVALIVALIALTAALQLLILRAYVQVDGTTQTFSDEAEALGSLSNSQRETLRTLNAVEALPRTRDLADLRLQRAVLQRHLSWMSAMAGRQPELLEQVPAVSEPLAEFDAALASLSDPPSTGEVEGVVPVLRDALQRSEVASRVLYGQQEQRLLASTLAALEARSQFQRLLLATSVLTIGVAGCLVVSLRRRIQADFGLAYDALRHQAYHDALTGLPNRPAFTERLGRVLGSADGGAVGVVYIDLDGFKTVNDSLGHQAGDDLLVVVAGRLEQATRPEDFLARLGGDEFTVLVPGRPDSAEPIAHRVADLLRDPVTIAGQEVFVTASVGIAYGAQGEDPEALLRDADAAMYEAKERGRATVERFRPELHERALERLQIVSALRTAIARDELRVHYQPIVELETARSTGVEALVRWAHPERGLVPPCSFVPLAEDSGTIVAIDGWVLGHACADVAGWNAAAATDPPLSLNVNMSARSFGDRTLVERVATALSDSGLPAGLLRLEITESAVMEDPVAATAMLQDLSALGVGLAIDDFGSGYSSLSQLRHFPVSQLKIDKGFVDHVDSDARDASVVRAIVTLAHTLGQRVVAEGIERDTQRARLRQLGCDDGQGYLFSKPLPADELLARLRERAPSMSGHGNG